MVYGYAMNKYSKVISILLFIASLGALGLGIKLKQQQEELLRHQSRLMNTVGDVAEALGISEHLPPLRSSGIELEQFTTEVKKALSEVAKTKHDTKRLENNLGQVSASQKVQSSQLRTTSEKLNKASAELLKKELALAEISKRQNEAEVALNKQRLEAAKLKAKLESARNAILEAEEQRIANQSKVVLPPKKAKPNAPAILARVASINLEWNFLVIDAGEHKNVQVDQEALVHRGKTLMGRIRITRVAPRHAVAEMMNDGRLETLQKGDTILFE